MSENQNNYVHYLRYNIPVVHIGAGRFTFTKVDLNQIKNPKPSEVLAHYELPEHTYGLQFLTAEDDEAALNKALSGGSSDAPIYFLGTAKDISIDTQKNEAWLVKPGDENANNIRQDMIKAKDFVIDPKTRKIIFQKNALVTS